MLKKKCFLFFKEMKRKKSVVFRFFLYARETDFCKSIFYFYDNICEVPRRLWRQRNVELTRLSRQIGFVQVIKVGMLQCLFSRNSLWRVVNKHPGNDLKCTVSVLFWIMFFFLNFRQLLSRQYARFSYQIIILCLHFQIR